LQTCVYVNNPHHFLFAVRLDSSMSLVGRNLKHENTSGVSVM
jgi:hypothetical protein